MTDAPQHSHTTEHQRQSAIKLGYALEIARKFSVAAIRSKSLETIARWEKAGVIGPAHREWLSIFEMHDDLTVIALMTAEDAIGYRLRQSAPYEGLLTEAELDTIRLRF